MPTTDGYNGAYTGAQIDEAIGQVRGKNLPADGVKFTDGETFQQKYDAGELTGPAGKNGATFTPAVDSSGNLSWSNDSGLANPETVNIRGPQGPKGDKGDKGNTGPAGANGKSAYQYAVDAGYTGTETDLSAALASLGDLNSILDTINGEVI